jgi:hypothetical protein
MGRSFIGVHAMFHFSRPFTLLSLLLAGIAANPGCGTIVRAILENDEELPVKNEAGLNALAQSFIAALDKKDYAAAYALCSKELKDRQTEEAFTAELKNNWDRLAKAAKPMHTEVTLYMPYKDELEEWDGFPKDIKYATLQGQITIEVGMTEIPLETAGDEPIYDGFDIDLFAVDDGGQPKIGYFEFYDYDDE